MSSEKISVVFPGQGSQYAGMLKDYFYTEPSFTKTFVLASEIIGIDLLQLVKRGTEKKIAATEITQPLMLVSDVALWNLISDKIDKPMCLAGHSLGEYAALVASGVISFEDSLNLVKIRSKLMQEAVPQGKGGIAAVIGLNKRSITSICKIISVDPKFSVNPANLNTSTQIVISGTKLGVDAALKVCRESGAKRTIILPMSIPSHCPLMTDASIKFQASLRKINFHTPKIPILHNVDYSSEIDTNKIKDKLVQQFYNPVRWEDTVNAISTLGVKKIYECGPGKVLSGLIKRISKAFITIDLDNYNNYKEIIND